MFPDPSSNQHPVMHETTCFKYYTTKNVININLDDDDQIHNQASLEVYVAGSGRDNCRSSDEDDGEMGYVEESIGSECYESGADTTNIQWSTQFWDLLKLLATKFKHNPASITSAYCDMAKLINNFSKQAGRLTLAYEENTHFILLSSHTWKIYNW